MSSLIATVTSVLARAPEWIRSDLASKDAGLRIRAEESLAAMIIDALTSADKSGDEKH